MTIDEAKKIIKSECYIADLLNLDRTQTVNIALDTLIDAVDQPRWIPCSERLPKDDDEVLVTDDACGLALVGIDWFDSDSNRWWCSQNVTAWMPLPEPARLEDDTDAKR